MTILGDDKKSGLRIAAALALATACSTKKAAPADAEAPDAGPVDAGPSWDPNVDAGPSEADQRAALEFFGHDPCPGCGMGGRLPRVHTPPKVDVVIGPTDSAVAASKPRFVACYDEALFARPETGGRMIVRLKLNEKGEVSKSDVVDSEIKGVMNVCASDVGRRIRFSPGPPRVVLVPLFFFHEHG